MNDTFDQFLAILGALSLIMCGIALIVFIVLYLSSPTVIYKDSKLRTTKEPVGLIMNDGKLFKLVPSELQDNASCRELQD